MASKLPLLLLLIAITCLSQFYRVSNSVIAPDLVRDLHLSPRELGWAGSVFFFALFAVQLPVGLWFDRFGARRTVSTISLLAAAGAVWVAYATDATGLIVGRVIMGLGCAASFMSVVFLCARWFAPAKLATALSWVFAGSNLGTLAGATPLAWIAATVGWRNGFLGLAVVTVAITALFYIVVRDRPPGSTLPATHRESLRDVFHGLWLVWRTKGLLPLLSMHFFAYATMLTVLGIWGGPYLFDVHGLGGVQRGNVLLAMGVAQTLGILSYGPMDRVLRSRKKVVFGGALISAFFLGALAPAAVARRHAAGRRLLFLRLRHRDRGPGPHALSRSAGRSRRHHREPGAMPRPHRAAGGDRLHRRRLRRGRYGLSPGLRYARGRPAARPDRLRALAGQRFRLVNGS
jgi:predicted MFS family arabinose efflux permease